MNCPCHGLGAIDHGASLELCGCPASEPDLSALLGAADYYSVRCLPCETCGEEAIGERWTGRHWESTCAACAAEAIGVTETAVRCVLGVRLTAADWDRWAEGLFEVSTIDVAECAEAAQ